MDNRAEVEEFLTTRRPDLSAASGVPPQHPPAPSPSGVLRREAVITLRTPVQITHSSSDVPTGKGPAENFTGDVYVDPVAAPAGPSRVLASLVHFTPGARTAWHRHPLGQTLFVTEGIGRVQRRGGSVEVIRPGDRVRIEPDEEHWHGATPDRLMVHLALNEVDDEHPAAHWGEHVTDAEYNAHD